MVGKCKIDHRNNTKAGRESRRWGKTQGKDGGWVDERGDIGIGKWKKEKKEKSPHFDPLRAASTALLRAGWVSRSGEAMRIRTAPTAREDRLLRMDA